MNKKRRDELHRLWLDVTGSAVTAIHRADGYRGSFVAGEGYELIKPRYLHDDDSQGKDLQEAGLNK